MKPYRFCPDCATELALISQAEDGGDKIRLRCPSCNFTHWNNPTPVLAAVIECVDREGQVLLARNAAWPGRFFGLVTGFLEAGESPEDGIRREIGEETSLSVDALHLLGVWDFQRMNQIIIACWPQGTGQAMATWLRSRGIEPQWLDLKKD
jgi:NAD+ diphosphatase